VGKISTSEMNDLLGFSTGHSPDGPGISAMPVIVRYTARIAGYSRHVRGNEHVFVFSQKVEVRDGGPEREEWDDKPLDAFKLRSEFEDVKTPEQALEFLERAGRFTPLDDAITWSEFQKWQRLTRLVREHEPLVTALKKGKKYGEKMQAVAAMGGRYDSLFFGAESRSIQDLTPQDAATIQAIKRGRAIEREQKRILRSWFGRPPGDALKIELLPIKIDKRVVKAVNERGPTVATREGGVMWDLLLPPAKLQPAVLIESRFAIQAIASTIYADRMLGFEFRSCGYSKCNRLFKLGSQKTQMYCGDRCKETVKKSRQRA
jgi:hypothetical protein